jgi:4-hydroxybenzoate polyprenyltransferase
VNTRPSQLLDYLRLVRLPNVFSALADVTMGFLFVAHVLRPVRMFLPLAAASALLYAAGMVLNDVWDVELDRRERPERPLPSGRIAVTAARRLGWTLLISGVLCGWLAGLMSWGETHWPWRSGVVATLLAACVVAYDARLKRTPLGPLGMGACRLLNVLLGMSAAAAVSVGSPSLAGFGLHHGLAAGGIGLYIAGVTWFARTEAEESRRWALVAATLVMVAGIALLAVLYRHMPPHWPRAVPSDKLWYLLLGLLAFTIVRRCALAVVEPSPRRVQAAVRNCLWSLIVLDAAVALLASPVAWSLVVLAFLVPTVILGHWFAST